MIVEFQVEERKCVASLLQQKGKKKLGRAREMFFIMEYCDKR